LIETPPKCLRQKGIFLCMAPKLLLGTYHLLTQNIFLLNTVFRHIAQDELVFQVNQFLFGSENNIILLTETGYTAGDSLLIS
jgi:hypothetical protein